MAITTNDFQTWKLKKKSYVKKRVRDKARKDLVLKQQTKKKIQPVSLPKSK